MLANYTFQILEGGKITNQCNSGSQNTVPVTNYMEMVSFDLSGTICSSFILLNQSTTLCYVLFKFQLLFFHTGSYYHFS